MPHLPQEEVAPSGLTDKVAKESSNSNASTHPIHDENTGIGDKAAAFQSKGPQISENLPEAKGKEELKAKAAELNK